MDGVCTLAQHARDPCGTKLQAGVRCVPTALCGHQPCVSNSLMPDNSHVLDKKDNTALCGHQPCEGNSRAWASCSSMNCGCQRMGALDGLSLCTRISAALCGPLWQLWLWP